MDTMTADVQAIVLSMNNVGISEWTDEKRKDFVRVFRDRSRAARYIYYKTAEIIIERARTKKFISQKHVAQHNEACRAGKMHELFDPKPEGVDQYSWAKTVGGRPIDELVVLAGQRAEEILNQLPSARKAIAIISPEVGKKMDRRDDLLHQGQELVDRLTELSSPIRLSEMDPDMKIGEFVAKAHDQERARGEILFELDRIGEEGNRLEDEINVALFHGIPELSEAVLKVARDHYDRGVFFSQAARRVEEKVLFGDSKEAMDILHHFEKDEIDVPSNIKSEFAGALERLRLKGKKNKEVKKAGA